VTATIRGVKIRRWLIAVGLVLVVVIAGLVLHVPQKGWCMSRLWPGHSVTFGQAVGVCADYSG